MKRSTVFILCVLTASVGGGVLPASTQPASADKKANISENKGKEGSASAVILFGRAASLVSYARDNESAVAMLAAAEMLRRLSLQEDRKRFGAMESEGGEDVENEPADTALTLDPKELLAEAKPWAKGNEPLIALIDTEMKKPAAPTRGTLGRAEGAKTQTRRIRPGEIQSYTLRFRGGEVAAVAVKGSGRTDLDLYIFDENGKVVGRDVGPTDSCSIVWTPKWTGPFTVRLKNEGRSKNAYRIATN